ncbi:hypothetical protein [Chitinophaga sp. Ak27]|uniref:hypothetical protein n=1 Tax=Chitinophaga sp. Ak27 TaxID=2726116 RepID=UPI00145D50B8|nr:hypothetical protein [Chitinophaga sp. Ak27]NLU92648.1 hypothetical protein [Chitinophaga sp. Ak27]
MDVETGQYFEWNHRKLDGLQNTDAAWAAAIEKCRREISIRLSKRTHFGAHSTTRLGEDAIDYYVEYAYDAVLSGSWQWKDEYSLSQQLCRIAGSVIDTEVQKFKVQQKNNEAQVIYEGAFDDLETYFYQQEELPVGFNDMDQLIMDQKIREIEELIKGDTNCEVFWDCIKEGMKPAEIAAIMEKTPKQLYKLREVFIKKIQSSPYFESDYYAKVKR